MSHGGRQEFQSAQTPQGPFQAPSEPGNASTLGPVESFGLDPSSQRPSELESTQESNSSSEDGRFRILKQLEETMESFQRGKATKTDTISSVLCILREDADVSVTQS